MEVVGQTHVYMEQPSSIKEPEYLKWEAFADRQRKKAPKGMKSLYQTTGLVWSFIPTEKQFIDQAISGICLTMVFVFLVLFIVTQNFIQALISVFCVGVIIVTVLSIIVFKGWEFGIAESVGVVIIIGLSVDYVVHLSATYIHTPFNDRHARMKQAYTEMGTSIASGTLTTFGSGVMLFGGQFTTFQKFAVLITSTIVFSFLMSMFLFGSIMHIMGPQRKFKDEPLPQPEEQPKETEQQEEPEVDGLQSTRPLNIIELVQQHQTPIKRPLDIEQPAP